MMKKIEYFHAKVKSRRRLQISRMLLGSDPNDWTKDVQVIHDTTIGHFHNHLSSKGGTLLEDQISVIP